MEELACIMLKNQLLRRLHELEGMTVCLKLTALDGKMLVKAKALEKNLRRLRSDIVKSECNHESMGKLRHKVEKHFEEILNLNSRLRLYDCTSISVIFNSIF